MTCVKYYLGGGVFFNFLYGEMSWDFIQPLPPYLNLTWDFLKCGFLMWMLDNGPKQYFFFVAIKKKNCVIFAETRKIRWDLTRLPSINYVFEKYVKKTCATASELYQLCRVLTTSQMFMLVYWNSMYVDLTYDPNFASKHRRHAACTHGYKSNNAKLVLLELDLYDVPVQSTVSLRSGFA